MKHFTISPWPSTCIVAIVHVVNGRQYCGYTAGLYDSDKSRCFIDRDELDSEAQLPNFRSVVAL